MELDFSQVKLKLDQSQDRPRVWDPVRKSWVRLTPEEWVRQHWIALLIDELGYPRGLLACEKQLSWAMNQRRYDLALMDRKGQPLALWEFKSQEVALSQQAINQLLAYHQHLRVSHLFLSNGVQHFGWYQQGGHWKDWNKMPSMSELIHH